MVSRRKLLVGGAVVLAGVGGYAVSRRGGDDKPIVRPPGVPLSDFGAESTAEEVTAGLDLSGKTYLITGATSGLGLEMARVLGMRGAHVIATGRTLEKAAAAASTLQGRFTPVALELTDFDSVVKCATTIAAAVPQLDGLVCNAGIMALPELEQVNGLEKQFVTNHLGHFILVNRLLDRVTAAPQGRVVVLSSGGYQWAPEAGIEFDNLSGEREYDPNKMYGQSKLANGLFVRELAKRLEPTSATVNAVHPGVIMTNLGRHFDEWKQVLARLIGWTFMKSIPAGAATQTYVATSPALADVSGYYFSDCNPEVPGPRMQDDALAARLWDVSADLTQSYLA